MASTGWGSTQTGRLRRGAAAACGWTEDICLPKQTAAHVHSHIQIYNPNTVWEAKLHVQQRKDVLDQGFTMTKKNRHHHLNQNSTGTEKWSWLHSLLALIRVIGERGFLGPAHPSRLKKCSAGFRPVSSSGQLVPYCPQNLIPASIHNPQA